MNTDQLQGSMKCFIGRLQEKLGILIGSTDLQTLGIRKQVTGSAERRIGDLQQMLCQADALAARVRSKSTGVIRLVK